MIQKQLKNIKIIHVSAWAKTFTQFRMPLLRRLHEAGCRQIIYCPYQKEHVDKLIDEGFRVKNTKVSTELEVNVLKQFWNLYAFLKKEHFDLLIAHQPMGALISIPAGRMANVPLKIYSTGGLKYYPERKNLFNHIIKHGENKILENSDAVFLVNIEDEKFLKGNSKFKKKAFYVGPLGGCGVNGKRYSPEKRNEHRHNARKEMGISSDIIVIGFVGRCVWEKGFREIVEAACIIKENRSDVHPQFLVFGEGQHLNEIIGYSKKRGVFTLFKFEGYKFNVAYYMSAFDVFLLPSHREGLPVSLLEAMAMGIPSIASSIRGCRELIKNDSLGLLVPVGEPKKLSDAILKLIDNDEYRLKIGEKAAGHIINNYEETILLSKTMKIISTLIQKTSGVEK